MIGSITKRFNTLPYQSQIIFLICVFGSVRMLLELVLDLTHILRFQELLIDSLIFGLLAAFLYTVWISESKHIHVLFGVVISILLAINFLQFGGISGHSKFNYYVGIYLIVIGYSGRALLGLTIFNLGLLMVILLLSHYKSPWLTVLDLGASLQTLDFWFSMIMLSFFTFYLKELTVLQGRKLSALNHKMAEQVREVRRLNLVLEQSNQELKQLQANLELEVYQRTEILQKKNQSIEDFIQVNSSDLIVAVGDLMESIQQVDDRLTYSAILKSSSKELSSVVQSIRNQLKEDASINRKIIRAHENHN